ncbi:MAG: glutamate synthase-related protein, partial [Planctomycetota bacterium]
MTETLHLAPRPAPPRFPVLRPYRIDRSEACINCGTCICTCLYACHERSPQDPRKMADPVEHCCRNCFACILHCPRGALSMHPSEAYRHQGGETYTPDVIRTTLDQAAEGKIPVSGAGYGGKFDGPGFDNLWTDMSEIVRPTRDGIHGREHISTTVSLGKRVGDLCGMRFDPEGNLKSQIPPTREVPIPVLFGLSPCSPGEEAVASLALAASKLTTYTTVRAEEHPERFMEYFNHLLVRLKPSDVKKHAGILEWATIIEFEPGGEPIPAIQNAREINPHLLTLLMVRAGPGVEDEILRLCEAGAETIHLRADMHGRGKDGVALLDCLQRSHRRLVEAGLRDRVTLLASGGVAAAEHVPKTIILGADAVMVDVPLFLAMECTLCGRCGRGEACPRGLGEIDRRWGATRVINLMLCWRDQLLEVLGAMGLRDVRRLRGETGRAIFADRAGEDFQRRLKAVPQAPDAVSGQTEESAEGAGEIPKSRISPSRFPQEIGEFRVVVDRKRCTDCGICAVRCKLGVHRRIEGKRVLGEPNHALCMGTPCLENDWCCQKVCPWEAIRIEGDPVDRVLGDCRWTARLIRATREQARTGEPTALDPDAQVGESGGGFDRLSLASPGTDPLGASVEVDLSMPMNRRSEGPKITIPVPLYGGGMSYGSISLPVMLGRAMAAKESGSFTCTGEGGYPSALIPYADQVITQVATGLFGVREETIQRARVVEFKYAQGAKPGLGGHLLGEKNTPDVASMREAVPGTSLFSPFPFHSVYSVEDHKKHLDWIRSIHPEALISVKVSTPADVDMVAVGSYYAGANIIHLDGSYGGTGAAPDIAKKNISQPIEYAVAQAHDFLVSEGIREEVVLIASGGVRTPEDVLKAVALGADGVVLGTAELVA